ncbi:MAG: carbamoyl phosphate synthase small subunit [Candidatus Marinimicrobia bacterium]|nr:carbamoyl phosphate synthase small subunit [Candidatus Neomarinimicrobiota bacterium]|tara:strand:- start:252 stop:1349 length:1098 start_codon:yes stop_codon:yes gene_type:complete
MSKTKNRKEKKAVLLLDDGRIFKGTIFGAIGDAIGEVCFNTGMTGYQEILTDPSYAKQMVTMTAPHIGNYGINSEDVESDKIQVSGFIIKEESFIPSNWRSQMSLADYLKKQNVVGIKDIDTRALTKHIRDNGAMNGIISSETDNMDKLESKLSDAPSMEGLDLTKIVSTKKIYQWSKEGKYKIAVIDFGIKKNILRLLESFGCSITVFPAETSAHKILSCSPDGVFLSNGPGDPAAVRYGIETIKKLLGVKPIFGICLGHQLLALALGAKTFKLKFGHRGINHPVKNMNSKKIEITSQNHGFAVELDSLPKNILSTHINLNDNTSAGIECTDYPAFSVQYHPESSPGPHDSRYLFDKFIGMLNA